MTEDSAAEITTSTDPATQRERWIELELREQSKIFAWVGVIVGLVIALGGQTVEAAHWKVAFGTIGAAYAATCLAYLSLVRADKLPVWLKPGYFAMFWSTAIFALTTTFVYEMRANLDWNVVDTIRTYSVVNPLWNPLVRAMAQEGAATAAWCLAAIFGLTFLPVSKRELGILFTLFVAVTIVVCMAIGHTRTMISIVVPCLTFGFAVAWRSIKHREQMADLEMRNLETLRKVITAKFERELELAKEIQTSALPDARIAVGRRIQVETFQFTHHKIGGDWMAVRELPDGRLIILVADVTGKGIQAALIVHAVQSLWARTLESHSFEPAEFFREVDTALRHLGKQKAQTLTMGIAMIEESRATYYSAGHTPAYYFEENGSELENVKRIQSVGNLLGLGLTPSLKVKTLAFPEDRDVQFIVASDGIFDGLIRPHEKSLATLLKSIATVGPHVIEMLPCEDDKTLVIVKRKAVR